MAAPALDVSLVEFATTLDPAKAPERLRCPKCPRLLIDAYKTSCCDVIVCGPCFEAANNSCPQCGHSPFNENTAKASSTTRKTLKSWLKDQKTKAEKPPLTPAPEGVADTSAQPSIDTSQENVTSGDPAEASESIKESASMSLPAEEQPIPSIEKPEEASELHSDPMDANDDDVEIQVDLDHDDASFAIQQDEEDQGQPQEYAAQPTSNDDTIRPESRNDHNSPAKPKFDLNGTGMQGMDFGNPMMQNMQMMMNGGFPAMAGMQMGMNPMGNMFGGFGPNGGVNGMNMMNFNPQNMFGNFQNSNMWQNNNANAFPNGMGGDFNYGLNSNFNNQQYPNGDFQSGYRGRGYGRGRGRGRGRGGYDRGRGNFYNNFDNRQNFQNGYDQQWNNQQQPQMNGQYHQQEVSKPEHVKEEDPNLDDDEFAPGGQEEVQEALGDDYAKKETKPEEPAPVETPVDEVDQHVSATAGAEPVDIDHLQAHTVDEAPPQDTQPIAEAYSEDLDMVMAPPSAPSGPAGRYGDKDFGFRSRGHGKYPRNRGSIHLSNGRGPSPVRSPSTQTVPRPGSAGQGVVGAPTGPRAMRDPPPKPSRAPSGGFQIMGRASLASRITEQRSPSPPQDNGDDREERSSRHHSRRDEDDDHDRSRKHRRSRRGDEDDYPSQDEVDSYSRHESQDRSRKSRRERDKHGSRSTKYETTRADEDLDMNDYGEPTDEAEKGSRRDRKHRERERERERDRDRGRDRDRERDSHRDRDRDRDKERDRNRGERDREREERHREKERDRKRRRDRDEDDAHDEDVDSSRHKSRRHRKEHTSANNRDDDQLNGRSSHRSSQVATPTATPSKEESEMDPITRERMERDRQRMMKEQQRRENAAATLKGGSSRSGGGARRQMSFKYEDEAERGMIEGERDRHRARWR